MASQQRYRAAVTDANSHYYSESSYATIKEITDEINGTGSMTVEVPIDDPEIGNYQAASREVAIFRDGLSAPFWRGPVVRPSASSQAPAKVAFQCQNPLWYFSHRYFGSPLFPTNYVLNGSLEVWAGAPSLPVHWTNSGGGPGAAHLTITQLTLQANPGQVLLGSSAALLTSGTLNADTFLNQIVPGGNIPANSEGYLFTLSAWFYIVPSMSAGPIGGRGLYFQFVNGGIVEAVCQPYIITPQTPTGMWIPASTTLFMPASATGTWAVDVRLYTGVTSGLGGSIAWDAVQLNVPESLSPAEPGGSDQAQILENIVRYAQGMTPSGVAPAVGFPVDHLKNNLNIGQTCPSTGSLRADLVYLMSDRQAILDAMNQFPTYSPEQDFAIIDTSPTSRNFTTFGRAITDGQTNTGTPNTFTSPSQAAFTQADRYQPLWAPQYIPGGSIITAVTSATTVTFSGPGAIVTGTGLSVFIGGRRGVYRPSVPLFFDATGANIVTVDSWDLDAEQMANSIVATGTSTGTGAYVGVAIKGVTIGTLTAARNNGTLYTTLAITASTVPVYAGDYIRLAAPQWQTGVGNEGEAILVTANAPAGSTTISISALGGGSWNPASTWGIGTTVTDYTPQPTMEDVLSLTTPSPIGSLTQQALGEMQARNSAVPILTVTTVNDFIDNWCSGTPLSAGDVLPVTSIVWGAFLNIVNKPYRIISWTLNPDTDAYKLQLNLVATT